MVASGARWHDESSRKVGAAGLSLSLSLCVGLTCETDRGKERGESGCVVRGKRPAKSGALLAYVRACVHACVALLDACGSCARACI